MEDKKKDYLLAKAAMAIPAVFMLLMIITSDFEPETAIYFIISIIYLALAIKNYIELRSGKRERNSTVVVIMTYFALLFIAFAGLIILIAMFSNHTILPGQR
ncbi:MAG: hypothetical protein GXY08_14140 [Ruminococcus sp.]|nr:hypothetical protein [Ruminococcus sp.]